MSSEDRLNSSATACAFVGLLDVDGDVMGNPAYSAAGAHFQECLLAALAGTSLAVTHVYALRPVPSVPRIAKLFFSARHVKVAGSIPATLIGFINAGPLKTLSGGMTLFPRLLAWAWRERRRERVILLYNLYSPPGIISILAARMTRSRAIAIVADLQIPGHGLLRDTALRRLDYWLQRVTLPYFDGLVVLTRAMAQDFAPSVPWIHMEGALPDRLLRDSDPLAQAPPAERSREEEFVIMYSGGLSPLKGVDRLLDAFSRLEGSGFRLWITGMGPLHQLVQAAARGDHRIKFWGFTEDSVLTSLYSSADVLVNPHSIRHATARYLFPSKLIEYLGTGVPVISTCSTPEIASEYGDLLILTPDDDARSLAETIASVAAMKRADRLAIGLRARDFVRSRKSWQVQAERISRFITHEVPGK